MTEVKSLYLGSVLHKNSSTMYYLQNLCLLCLKNNGLLKNIYQEDSDNISILGKLEYIIEILGNDFHGTSLYICEMCHIKLNNTYVFKQQSIQNINYLKDYSRQLCTMNKKFKHLSVILDKINVEQSELDQFHADGNIDDEFENEDIEHECNENMVMFKTEAVCIKVENKNENDSEQNQLEEDISEVKREEFRIKDIINHNKSYDDIDMFIPEAVYTKIENINENDTVQSHNEEDIDLNSEPFERQISNSDDMESEVQNKSIDQNSTNHHNQDKPFRCSVCRKDVVLSKYLSRHLKIHSEDKPFKCHLCSKAYTQRHLGLHKKTHTGEKPFKCHMCAKKFSVKSKLSRHLRTHSGEKPFNCHICAKKFSDKSNLNKHTRIHTREKSFKGHCGEAFHGASNLSIHSSIHIGEKLYKCHICAETFTGINNLSVHKKTHTGEKSFKCHICTKKFSIQSKLSRHLRTHTGEKPFNCHVCAKAFSTASHLNVHRRTHTGEKRFKCHICAEAFIEKRNLTRHIRTHTGEKPFKCHICAKAFSRASSLSVHIRIHTGEKPFRCHICAKAFIENRTLRKHIMNHTAKELFKCHLCSKAFIKKEDLNCHMSNHEYNANISFETDIQNTIKVEALHERDIEKSQIEEDISAFKREEDIDVDSELFVNQISNSNIKRELENK